MIFDYHLTRNRINPYINWFAFFLILNGCFPLLDKTEKDMKKALDELELWKEKIKLYDT